MSWSTRVANRFQLRLPPDLIAWLDEDAWRIPGGLEFCNPLPPEQIVDPHPGAIWAGFMLPDTLPVIGNQYGDWLCLRVDERGEVTEVVYWCHAGGDWLPYGDTLSEALLYDAAFRVMHPWRLADSVPQPVADESHQAAEWAIQHIHTNGKHLPRFWTKQAVGADLLQTFIDAGVAQVAAHRDLLLHHLNSPLKARSNLKMAAELGVSWEPDLVSWIFDTAMIPPPYRERLRQQFETPFEELTRQDWILAESEALKVIECRSDLGWAYDIAGWAAERRGDLELAVQRYLSGLQTSLFSDDTVRFRTHWISDGHAKFAAARLAEHQDALPAKILEDAYLQVFLQNDASSLRERSRAYWMQKARQAQGAEDHAAAYHCFYRAGWDVGSHVMSAYEEILEGLAESANAAGWPARARVAEMHRDFFQPK